MGKISERDVVAAIGAADELIIRETVRTKASLLEFRRALAFAKSSANSDALAYRALTPLMQRLVDLLSVAEDSVSRSQATQTLTLAPEARHRAA